MSEFIDEFGEHAPENRLTIYFNEIVETRIYNGKLLASIDKTACSFEWSLNLHHRTLRIKSPDGNKSAVFDHLPALKKHIMETVYNFVQSQNSASAFNPDSLTVEVIA